MKRLLLLLPLLMLTLTSCLEPPNTQYKAGDTVIHRFTGDTLMVREAYRGEQIRAMSDDYELMLLDNHEVHKVEPAIADTVLWERMGEYREYKEDEGSVARTEECEREIREYIGNNDLPGYEKHEFTACGEKHYYYRSKGFRVWKAED